MGGKNPERYPPRMDDYLKLAEWAEDYPAWAFMAACNRCIHRDVLFPRKLLRLRKPPNRIGELKARLVCKECGSRLHSLRPEFLFRRD
jgi:hypothetical protein